MPLNATSAPAPAPVAPQARKRPFVLAIIVLILVVATVVALGLRRGHGGMNGHPSAVTCGGKTVTVSHGVTMRCTFDDEFGGSSLDMTKWTAWNDVNWFSSRNLCYYSDPRHVAVADGYLKLSATRLAPGATCRTPHAPTRPSYGSGVVHTKYHFSQTYGRFEARIKFAGGVGMHEDFWLYPVAKGYPGQAEIDIAEPYGAHPNTMNAVTHVTGPAGTDIGRLHRCTIKDWPGAFHTYAVDWTPKSITFDYDGRTCFTVSRWTPVRGFSFPAPFNQNFFVILQLGVDDGSFSPAPNATTRFPARMLVDWVRVWK